MQLSIAYGSNRICLYNKTDKKKRHFLGGLEIFDHRDPRAVVGLFDLYVVHEAFH